MMQKIIKVAHNSDVNKLAGSIALSLYEDKFVYIQAIGSQSVNQAVKAIITTRRYLAPNSHDLTVLPSFKMLNLDGEEKTAIKFYVKLTSALS
jgi:stage V sporulation protein S